MAEPARGVEGRGLLRQTLHGAFWSSSGFLAQTLLQIAVLTILARLLSPEDFGIIAAALVVTSFSQIFVSVGFGPALVQRQDVEPRHVHSALTASILLGLALGAAVYLLAGPVSGFFDVEGLVPVIRVLSLEFPILGVAVVPKALLQRRLAFRTLARIQVLSYALGYTTFGIGLGLLGYGVWALVAAVLAERVVSTILTFLAERPPLRFSLDRAALADLVHIGGGLAAMRVANYFAMRGDYIVTGRWLGMTALGLYERAYRLMAVPVTVLGSVLDQVLFPTLSRIQEDRARLGTVYLTVVSVTALLALPLSAVAFVLAPEVILVFLGERWAGAIAPFRILTLGIYLRTGYRIGIPVAQATGAVYRGAWRQLVYAVAVVAGSLIGQRWGIEGVAWGVLFALATMFLLTHHLVQSLTELRWRDFARAHGRALALALFLAAETWAAAGVLRDLGLHPLVVLATATAIAGGTALLLAWRFPERVLGRRGLQILNAAGEELRGGGEARS